MKVLVGISGGVDSALTAITLKEQGHEVICAMMKIYDGKQLSSFAHSCYGEINEPQRGGVSCYGADKSKEIEDAKTICEKIDAEFHLIDCSKEFDNIVFKKFQNEYLQGRTPNPCVICNAKIKFGEFLKGAIKSGVKFDKFATGHYARVEFDKNLNRYMLKTGKNPKKDQSYFLYNLSQEQLSKIIFPLGESTKEQTREMAKEKGLIVAQKPDSQDFFKGDYSCLLNIEPKIGNIIDINGKIYGQHEGIWNFTIGQRKGLKIAHSEPLYVLKLNSETNEVVVGTKSETFCNGLIAEKPNWIAFETLKEDLECKCKIRSAQSPVSCKVSKQDDKITVKFEQPQASIAPGQAVVFYGSSEQSSHGNDTVLGGATIIEGK